jgi:hypothetical protein
MRKAIVVAVLLATFSAQAQVPTIAHNYEFVNGNWIMLISRATSFPKLMRHSLAKNRSSW